MKTNKPLSATRLARLRDQGFWTQSDEELNDLAFGIRFAYRLCTSIVFFGIATQNVTILIAMMGVAFLSVFLPNHAFDYIYNAFLAERMNKPKLPERSVQIKFACSIATVWLGGLIYLFAIGQTSTALILGAIFLVIAISVSTLDFCVPSKIYNALFLDSEKKKAGMLS